MFGELTEAGPWRTEQARGPGSTWIAAPALCSRALANTEISGISAGTGSCPLTGPSWPRGFLGPSHVAYSTGCSTSARCSLSPCEESLTSWTKQGPKEWDAGQPERSLETDFPATPASPHSCARVPPCDGRGLCDQAAEPAAQHGSSLGSGRPVLRTGHPAPHSQALQPAQARGDQAQRPCWAVPRSGLSCEADWSTRGQPVILTLLHSGQSQERGQNTDGHLRVSGFTRSLSLCRVDWRPGRPGCVHPCTAWPPWQWGSSPGLQVSRPQLLPTQGFPESALDKEPTDMQGEEFGRERTREGRVQGSGLNA